MAILGLDWDTNDQRADGLMSRGVPVRLVTNQHAVASAADSSRERLAGESSAELAEELIEELRRDLRVSDAPMVVAGLAAVLKFFQRDLHVPPSEWISYLRGIDFHSRVFIDIVRPPKEFVRHKWVKDKTEYQGRNPIPITQVLQSEAKPFVYFADVGASPMRTGTNFQSDVDRAVQKDPGSRAGVVFQRFRLNARVRALVSKASHLSWQPGRKNEEGPIELDEFARPGGAIQYIIPTRRFFARCELIRAELRTA